MDNKIPILDMKPEIEALWNEFNAAFQGVLQGTQFIMGPNVKTLEQEVAAYMGAKHAIACNSGTDALVMGVRALGVSEGDEVITTPFTFFATAEAIGHAGAVPVFVDIDPVTFNIDVNQIEAKITSKTKAIIPVHLYGHAAEMGAIMAIAEKHGIKVLEDCAQSFGTEYKGKKTSAIGDAGALSFFPSKNLGAFGDGGMLITNDDEVAACTRMLRVHGASKKYYNEVVGYNSRLDEMQAAMLRVKLPHIDEFNTGRREAAARYAELLAGVPGVTVPSEADYTRHVYHQYTIRIAGGRRDEIAKGLGEMGVSTMVYYPVPVHKLPVYAGLNISLPTSEAMAAEVVSLPIWPKITPEIQQRVADALKSLLA